MTDTHEMQRIVEPILGQGYEMAVLPTYPENSDHRSDHVSVDSTIRALDTAGIAAACPVEYKKDDAQNADSEDQVLAMMVLPDEIVLPVLMLLNEQPIAERVIPAILELIDAAKRALFFAKDGIRSRLLIVVIERPNFELKLIAASGTSDDIKETLTKRLP